jgi:ribonuclease T2
MKRTPLAIAIAALVAAIAAFLGIDLETLTRDPGSKPAAPASSGGAPPPAATGDFDHYVLALSWSPTYCETEATDRDRLQCGSGRPFAFIVHGLWPEAGPGGEDPANCDPDGRVSSRIIDGLLDIMPAPGLIGHQWRKHGSCTGLGQEDFFATLRRAYQAIVIPADFKALADYRTLAPAEVVRQFALANPSIPKDGIAVTCPGRQLSEVRICLTKDLKPRSCPSLARSSCRRDQVVMPPVRAGR